MDLDPSPDEAAFRAEARSWLAAHVPTAPLPSLETAEGFAAHRAWERTLAADGWSVVSWPRRYGGRGASTTEWLLFEEEYYAAGAPGRVSQNGTQLLAPTLFAHGTAEQRARVLPPMAAGEVIWAQAWSEPEAGSDLAALRATARRTSGGWLLYGQKTWSSRAAFADRAFGLFRGGPTGERPHQGLTYVMLPLDAPGVTVRPIRRLDGKPAFAELFLDGVFVPDRDVIGEPGQGWRVAMSTAGSERGLTLRSPGRFTAAAERLAALWRERADPADTALRDRVADAVIAARAYHLRACATATREAEAAAARATEGRTAEAWSGTRASARAAVRRHAAAATARAADRQNADNPAEASVNKVFWSELDLALHETALDLLGPYGELSDAATDAPGGGRWAEGYVFSLAGPVYAGTNEIQRDIIAERLLGLDRGRR
ncbi:acyl-CoA dehydrogenase family protein [Streptomyces sp. SAJ15]|uniref:acyl-CoA dehydrogenase family protein n=1 Tax=Streptomyces sp. SAJ15 TaxID=2011095 RepID=UPI001185AE3B|nr:acyl-CoA dehydrogenase family protein [Streptomyces sp. SAJ15]TVL89535.1 acyl-CoA dehydrogenase [Streptomyces sp. SAJ15]